MKSGVKYTIGLSVTALLAACSSGGGDSVNTAPATQARGSAVMDGPVKLGEPYQVNGKTYTPADIIDYDDVGYASWYGQELAGRQTANGEIFNPSAISAAHKTLPLPSYVEVTDLETGRTILVRVNDRGPFADDRLIDLSYGAAQQLGIDDKGVTAVRVRRVNPPEQEKSVLRNAGFVGERLATPDSLLTILRKKAAELPKPVVPDRNVARTRMPSSTAPRTGQPAASSGDRSGRFIVEGEGAVRNPSPVPATRRPVTSPSTAEYYVQVAAFGSRSRAEALAGKIGAKAMPSASGNIWRVRYGPYESSSKAEQGLEMARKRGYGSARVYRGN